jgi:hypothetical protein
MPRALVGIAISSTGQIVGALDHAAIFVDDDVNIIEAPAACGTQYLGLSGDRIAGRTPPGGYGPSRQTKSGRICGILPA